MREIGNQLPEAVAKIKAGMILQHTTKIDEIVVIWKENDLPLDGSFPGAQVTAAPSSPGPNSVQIPRNVYNAVAELIRDHDRTRSTRNDAAVAMFEEVLREDNDRLNLRIVVKEWRSAIDWFIRNAHDSSRLDADLDLVALEKNFALFEASLAAIVRQFFETSEEIDDIIKNANS
jgi:hypothetical protein